MNKNCFFTKSSSLRFIISGGESISKEKVLKHLSLGEVGIERIYGIAEIMGVHSNRESSDYVDYGAMFRGDAIYFRIEKTQDFREYSSVGMLCLEAL